METIIKQAREVGTSAGVLLPRRWLNKEVIVTLYQPSFEELAKDKLLKNLRKSLAYQWMIREARAIIDKNLLENMRKQMPVLNVQEQLSEIRSVTRINQDIIKTCEENCMDV